MKLIDQNDLHFLIDRSTLFTITFIVHWNPYTRHAVAIKPIITEGWFSFPPLFPNVMYCQMTHLKQIAVV